VLPFLALLGIAIAISGAMAFVFFWPMSLVHLRDRHGELLASFGPAAFVSPAALGWLVSGRYRALADRSLNGLCTPARLAFFSIAFGLVASAILFAFD
jgi:hypothetical protein